MAEWRWYAAGLVSFGLVSAAQAQDCYYGSGRYTVGTVFCQSGQRMQCRKGDDGQPEWASLEQSCDDFARASELEAAPPDASVRSNSTPPAEESPATAGVDAADTAVSQPAATIADRDPPAVPARATQPATRAGETIEILWADYGRDGSSCDAGPLLAQKCDGTEACEIAVNASSLCDGGPVPGRKKLLSVYWQCNKNGENLRAKSPAYGEEGGRLDLRCP